MGVNLVSSAHAKKHGGVDAGHLYKIKKIDIEESERTLGVTTEQRQCIDNPKLSINYGTSIRMLRYKSIQEYFFMDTLLTTKKSVNCPEVTSVVRFF